MTVLRNLLPRRRARPGSVLPNLRGFRMVDKDGIERLHGIVLTIRAGEILGIAGSAAMGRARGCKSSAASPNRARRSKARWC